MTDRYGAHPDDYDPPVDLTKPNSAPSYSTPVEGAPGYVVQGSPGAGQSYYPGAQGAGSGQALGPATSRLALTGFILSLVSIILNFAGLTPLAALIISIIGLTRDVNKRGLKGRGYAIAGIIISVLVLVLTVIGIIAAVAFFSKYCTQTPGGSYSCDYSGSNSF